MHRTAQEPLTGSRRSRAKWRVPHSLYQEAADWALRAFMRRAVSMRLSPLRIASRARAQADALISRFRQPRCRDCERPFDLGSSASHDLEAPDFQAAQRDEAAHRAELSRWGI